MWTPTVSRRACACHCWIVTTSWSWRLSLGILGAGDRGSNYQASLGKPLTLLQAETQQRLLGGLLGNYRVYAWSNRRRCSSAWRYP